MQGTHAPPRATHATTEPPDEADTPGPRQCSAHSLCPSRPCCAPTQGVGDPCLDAGGADVADAVLVLWLHQHHHLDVPQGLHGHLWVPAPSAPCQHALGPPGAMGTPLVHPRGMLITASSQPLPPKAVPQGIPPPSISIHSYPAPGEHPKIPGVSRPGAPTATQHHESTPEQPVSQSQSTATPGTLSITHLHHPPVPAPHSPQVPLTPWFLPGGTRPL